MHKPAWQMEAVPREPGVALPGWLWHGWGPDSASALFAPTQFSLQCLGRFGLGFQKASAARAMPLPLG